MAPQRKTRTKRSRAANSSVSTRRPDGIALLKKDHRTVESLFKRYEKLGDRAIRGKANIVERVIRELSIHAAIEEQVLYPTIRQEVSGGKPKVEHAIDEHQKVKETLSSLQKVKPEDEAMDELMAGLISDVREHVKEEEAELFPKLRSSVEPAVLKRMGEFMQMAKRTAPTRPHPKAPAKPPANIVAGMAAGILDRVMDAGRATRKRVGASR